MTFRFHFLRRKTSISHPSQNKHDHQLIRSDDRQVRQHILPPLTIPINNVITSPCLAQCVYQVGTSSLTMGSSESKHATDDVNNKAEHHQAPHLEATTVTREEPSTEATGGGCPMKRSDGSYSFDWGALFRPSFPHGPGGEKPMSEQAARDAVSSKIADSGDNQSSGGGCPVKHSKSGSTHPEYNVYSQPIDPTNNMPKVANQLPAPNQSKALSTERVASTIPKVCYYGQ